MSSPTEPAVVAQGAPAYLRELRAVLVEAGIAAELVRPPGGAGKG